MYASRLQIRPCSTVSRNKALTRVCQPLPVALKWFNTTASMRSVTLGRGTSTAGLPTGRTPIRIDSLMRSNSSSIKKGQSGSLMAKVVISASSSSVGKIVQGLSLGIVSLYSRIPNGLTVSTLLAPARIILIYFIFIDFLILLT